LIKLKKGGKMALSRKRFTEWAATWYTYKFELKRVGHKEYWIGIVKPGRCVDIVTFMRNSRRYIDAKGQYYAKPADFRIYKTALSYHKLIKATPIKSRNYFIYLIFNIYSNETPRLAILDSKFLRKHGKIGRDRTLHIHEVAAGIMKSRTKIYRLPKLTSARRKTIIDFYKRTKREPDFEHIYLKKSSR